MKTTKLYFFIIFLLTSTFANAQVYCITDGGINYCGIQAGTSLQTRVNNDVISLPSASTGMYKYLVTTSGGSFLSYYLLIDSYSWTAGSTTNISTGPHNLSFNLTAFAGTTPCSTEDLNITFYALTPSGTYFPVCIYTLHVTVTPSSRSNLTFAEGYGQLFYTGDDNLIYTEWWTGSTWSQAAITPTGGWGSVRVAGNISVASDMSRVYFKGTDNKLYNLVNTGSAWTLSQVLSTLPALHASSNVCARGPSEVVVVTSNGALHRLLYSGTWTDNTVTPIGGWGSVTVQPSTFTVVQTTNNIFITSSTGVIYNLSASHAGWALTQVGPSGSGPQYCASDLVATENASVYYRGIDNHVHCFNKISGTWTYDAMLASNDPSTEVAGFLTKFPNDDRVFYKSRGGQLFNVYKSAGTWYNYSLDYNTANVAGDVVVGEAKVFYISTTKLIHGYYYAGGWYGGAVVSSPANAYGCSLEYYNYNTRLAHGEDDMNTLSDAVINVYPNPSSDGQFTIETNSDESKQIKVIDAMGRVVLETNAADRVIHLNLEGQSKGFYVISIIEGDKVLRSTVIIQ